MRSFVSALSRFPREPRWAVVGGFAVNVRIARVHRLTNDLDTVSQDQASLVEILIADTETDRLDATKLRFTGGEMPVEIDVMGDMADVPLPLEPSERAFALARRLALTTSEWIDLLVAEDGQIVADTSAPVATVASLVALKTVAIPRRSASKNPQKVGSDIHDLVRLVHGHDLDAMASEISEAGDELRGWVADTLVKWFSPDQDLRYTFARLRRLAGSTDADAITEDDLAVVAELGQALSKWALRGSRPAVAIAERPPGEPRGGGEGP